MRLLTVGFEVCSEGSRGVTAIKMSEQSVLLNKCLQTAYLSTAITMSVRSRCCPWVRAASFDRVTRGNGVKRIISTISARLFYNPILRSNHKTNPATMAVHTKSSSQIISRSRALVVRYFPAHTASGGVGGFRTSLNRPCCVARGPSMSVTDARGICGIGLDRGSFDLRMNSCISRREPGD